MGNRENYVDETNVEEKLKTYIDDEVLFTWGNQPGNDCDYDRVKYFLKENFGTDWLDGQEVGTDKGVKKEITPGVIWRRANQKC